MPLSKESYEAARAAEKKLTEILKEVKLNPDGTLNKDAVEKVNSALTEIAREGVTPPVMLSGVPFEVKKEFYKVAADYYGMKTEESYRPIAKKYQVLHEIAKKNKF